MFFCGGYGSVWVVFVVVTRVLIRCHSHQDMCCTVLTGSPGSQLRPTMVQ
jgi:hypothetical protein